jgi:NAD+ synthase (glutamine-hydrolysing)
LLDAAEHSLMQLLDFIRQLDIISVVGLPVVVGGQLLNCAAVIQRGSILGIVPKTYLPNYNEFYEKRWFASAQDLRPTEIHFAGHNVIVTPDPQLFRTCEGVTFGVEICEDVWAPTPPSNHLTLAGAEIVCNLSASNELIGKHAYLKALLAQQSARTIAGYIYSSAGYGESTQDVVYGGNALIYEDGKLLRGTALRQPKEAEQTSTVDVKRLRSDRRNNTPLSMPSAAWPPEVIRLCKHHHQAHDFVLEREVNRCLIPSSDDMQQSCER